MVGEGEIILGFAHMLQHPQHLRVPLAWWNTGILIEWTTRATPNQRIPLQRHKIEREEKCHNHFCYENVVGEL